MTRNSGGDAIFSAKEWRRIKQAIAVLLVLGPTVGAGTSKGIDAISRPAASEQLDKIEARLMRIESILMKERR